MQVFDCNKINEREFDCPKARVGGPNGRWALESGRKGVGVGYGGVE